VSLFQNVEKLISISEYHIQKLKEENISYSDVKNPELYIDTVGSTYLSKVKYMVMILITTVILEAMDSAYMCFITVTLIISCMSTRKLTPVTNIYKRTCITFYLIWFYVLIDFLHIESYPCILVPVVDDDEGI